MVMVCTGLGGLGSSVGQRGRSGVDLGRQALPRSRGNRLPGATRRWVGLCFLGLLCFLPAKKATRASAYLAARRICRRGSGPCGRPGGRVAQGAPKRNGSGGRAQEAWGLGARCSHLLLLQRKVSAASCQAAPGPAPPCPASAGWEKSRGYDGVGGGQIPAARPRRRSGATPLGQTWGGKGEVWPGGSRVLRASFGSYPTTSTPRHVPAASTRGRCLLGDLCSPPRSVPSKAQRGRWTARRTQGASVQKGASDPS